ncbi:DNA glycosylase AlkZ-like family protein [Teichococcus wenyumeiae]|uniref:DNA glycosylase AlkZ-like family protein n=1 Tax=Teichococcus wenyumeiae TaxID=2478470 RepID=UPI0038CFC894
MVSALLQVRALEQDSVEGECYLWPAGTADGQRQPVPWDLRILAPFAPLAWDRRRFEHLWGRPYRFEAHTPPAQREFGYYVMPLFYGDAVIVWANLALVEGQLRSI